MNKSVQWTNIEIFTKINLSRLRSCRMRRRWSSSPVGHLICPPFTQHATTLMMILSSHSPTGWTSPQQETSSCNQGEDIALIKQIISVRTLAIKMGIFIQYFHQKDTKINNNSYQNMIWDMGNNFCNNW